MKKRKMSMRKMKPQLSFQTQKRLFHELATMTGIPHIVIDQENNVICNFLKLSLLCFYHFNSSSLVHIIKQQEINIAINNFQCNPKFTICNRCLCGSCAWMDTEAESTCCQEQPPVLLKLMQWNQQGSCVLQHPFFVSVCLNPYALQTIYSRDKRLFGSLFNKPLHEQVSALNAFSYT